MSALEHCGDAAAGGGAVGVKLETFTGVHEPLSTLEHAGAPPVPVRTDTTSQVPLPDEPDEEEEEEDGLDEPEEVGALVTLDEEPVLVALAEPVLELEPDVALLDAL